jgi:hypothetical protein
MSSNITVKSDLIRDSGLSFDKGVVNIRRVFVVSGLDPTRTDHYSVALSAPNIPTYGQSHPNYPFAQAKTFEVSPIISNGLANNTAVEVVVTYNSQMEGVSFSIDFGSTLSQVMTDTDREGDEIYVWWSARKEKKGGIPGTPYGGELVSIPQRAEVPKMVRHDTIRYTIWLINVKNTLEYPTPIELLKEKYLGKVNSTPFRGGVPHDWMVTICDGSTQDFGKSYIITLEIERRPVPNTFYFDPPPGGWDEWAWYTTESDGIAYGVSKDVEDGVKLIRNLYDEVDFHQIPADLTTLKTTASKDI